MASLLLSRALMRKKEIAVRAAIGAGRSAIVRLLLVESVLLALFSGALGLLVAEWGISILTSLGGDSLGMPAELPIDFRVLAFSAGISLVSGILFGLIPALQLSKPDLNTVLRDEGRGSTGSRRRNLARKCAGGGLRWGCRWF